MTRPHDPGLVAAIYLSSSGLLSSCSTDQFVQTVQIVQAVQNVSGTGARFNVQEFKGSIVQGRKALRRDISLFQTVRFWR
jgi:hypothetical protein